MGSPFEFPRIHIRVNTPTKQDLLRIPAVADIPLTVTGAHLSAANLTETRQPITPPTIRHLPAAARRFILTTHHKRPPPRRHRIIVHYTTVVGAAVTWRVQNSRRTHLHNPLKVAWMMILLQIIIFHLKQIQEQIEAKNIMRKLRTKNN